MNKQSKQDSVSTEFTLESIIIPAIQIPGVKVDRNKFLAEMFVHTDIPLQDIIDNGTIAAGCSKEMLQDLCKKLILKRTTESSIASFIAGIPGGWAMAATIPADILQFFGMSLRLAQEISYLYGADDIWQNGKVSEDQVKNQLILYCGVMFGVSSATTGVRVLTTQIAKTTLRQLPQKALTKTFWYPIVRQIGKAIGIKVTKTTVAKGISKIVPIVGGVFSGTLNFISLLPMAKRLQTIMEDAIFCYTPEDLEADIDELEQSNIIEDTTDFIDENPHASEVSMQTSQVDDTINITQKTINNTETGFNRAGNSLKKVGAGLKNVGINISKRFSKKNKAEEIITINGEEVFSYIEKLADLRARELITTEEFESKKKELLDRL